MAGFDAHSYSDFETGPTDHADVEPYMFEPEVSSEGSSSANESEGDLSDRLTDMTW